MVILNLGLKIVSFFSSFFALNVYVQILNSSFSVNPNVMIQNIPVWSPTTALTESFEEVPGHEESKVRPQIQVSYIVSC